MTNDTRKEFNSIRNFYFNLHPLCEYCGSEGKHVHHIIPISKGGDNRESNLITLCLDCHSKIHNRNFTVTEDWRQKQREGIEKAKKMGKYKGRQCKSKPDNWNDLLKDYYSRKINKTQLAEICNVSRPTIYKWFEEEGDKNDSASI